MAYSDLAYLDEFSFRFNDRDEYNLMDRVLQASF